MCGGEGTAMCGEPRVAAECTCTERDFGRCSRPTVRPGRNVNDDRDHGDGSDTRPRGRRTSGSLTETRVRAWQYWPERFDGSADRNMNPCPLDGTDQLARTVLAAGVEPDGPVDADGDQARVMALLHESNVARNDPDPVVGHRLIAYDAGLPKSLIRFSTLHARTASAPCPAELRARKPSPMMDLYRKKTFSTRACRW